MINYSSKQAQPVSFRYTVKVWHNISLVCCLFACLLEWYKHCLIVTFNYIDVACLWGGRQNLQVGNICLARQAVFIHTQNLKGSNPCQASKVETRLVYTRERWDQGSVGADEKYFLWVSLINQLISRVGQVGRLSRGGSPV